MSQVGNVSSKSKESAAYLMEYLNTPSTISDDGWENNASIILEKSNSVIVKGSHVNPVASTLYKPENENDALQYNIKATTRVVKTLIRDEENSIQEEEEESESETASESSSIMCVSENALDIYFNKVSRINAEPFLEDYENDPNSVSGQKWTYHSRANSQMSDSETLKDTPDDDDDEEYTQSSSEISSIAKTMADIEHIIPKDRFEFLLFKHSYRVLKLLDSGSFGDVYLASIESDKHDKRSRSRQYVAIKFLPYSCFTVSENDVFPHKDGGGDNGHNDIQYRIEREGDILSRCSHPHILKFHKQFQDKDENIYIVTEYVRGGNLLDIVNLEGRLNEQYARMIFTQLISALEYLHSKGICHRDIKLDNVLIDRRSGNCKLIDFGFARFISDMFCHHPNNKSNVVVTTTTETKEAPEPQSSPFQEAYRSAVREDGVLLPRYFTPCGTIEYAAPEIYASQYYNPFQSDVWSCGVVLFCMLTGRYPWPTVEREIDIVPKNIPHNNNNNSMAMMMQKKKQNIYSNIRNFNSDSLNVLCTRYDVSWSCVSLLKTLLKVEVEKRPTLQQIKDHVWLRKHALESFLPPLNPIDSGSWLCIHLLSIIGQFGFKLDHVVQDLLSNKSTVSTRFYHLLYDCFNAKNTSDVGSKKPQTFGSVGEGKREQEDTNIVQSTLDLDVEYVLNAVRDRNMTLLLTQNTTLISLLYKATQFESPLNSFNYGKKGDTMVLGGGGGDDNGHRNSPHFHTSDDNEYIVQNGGGGVDDDNSTEGSKIDDNIIGDGIDRTFDDYQCCRHCKRVYPVQSIHKCRVRGDKRKSSQLKKSTITSKAKQFLKQHAPGQKTNGNSSPKNTKKNTRSLVRDTSGTGSGLYKKKTSRHDSANELVVREEKTILQRKQNYQQHRSVTDPDMIRACDCYYRCHCNECCENCIDIKRQQCEKTIHTATTTTTKNDNGEITCPFVGQKQQHGQQSPADIIGDRGKRKKNKKLFTSDPPRKKKTLSPMQVSDRHRQQKPRDTTREKEEKKKKHYTLPSSCTRNKHADSFSSPISDSLQHMDSTSLSLVIQQFTSDRGMDVDDGGEKDVSLCVDWSSEDREEEFRHEMEQYRKINALDCSDEIVGSGRKSKKKRGKEKHKNSQGNSWISSLKTTVRRKNINKTGDDDNVNYDDRDVLSPQQQKSPRSPFSRRRKLRHPH